jgi:hypothetical protein
VQSVPAMVQPPPKHFAPLAQSVSTVQLLEYALQ